MTSDSLERLVGLGLLKQEPPGRAEVEGLIRTATVRLQDARNERNSPESRFDLAYNAAHALALAALRLRGYRAAKRYVVFQALALTVGMPPAKWRVLAKCHEIRNTTGDAPDPGVQHLWDLLAAFPKATLVTGDRALVKSRKSYSVITPVAMWKIVARG